ncbi:LytTR family DNA-binding domain-containing protein [Flavobacterium sp. CS20]|uniref:LytR/AlgR family response regulator transcription factor n=1 Tax=Flavobacterium sp. CS20 TaxID=2775246 RepID=UPI001B3A6BB6|nr:LytTR family DNA-binding domain-containing protein [Flavobacterium sp. CS20]QTY26029.1 response regulator transcription factor [Flavobacterium sp. CS20]
MNILIIEDENASAKLLSQTIKTVDPSVKIIGVFEDKSETLRVLKKHSAVDAIFSDIQLADDLSFSILKEIDPKIPIVFVTAYNHYALEAFKHHGIDYVLKPFSRDDITQALNKLKTYKKGQTIAQNKKVYHLFEEIKKSQSYKKTFLVSFQDRLLPISSSDIAFFYTAEDGVYLTITSAKSYRWHESLEQLEKQLDSDDFYRANRQFIINRKYIEDIRHYFNGRLKIKMKVQSQDNIIVSKAKASDFKNWLSQ